MGVGRWFALVLVLVLIVPPALGARSCETPSTNTPAGPRAFEPWWGTGWLRRAPVTIDNRPSAAALSNYQVLVNITYTGRMNSDFSDIRFVQNVSGVPRELPYWLEGKQDGQAARAWVNVSQLPAQAASVIYMYYGNPSAANASDGNTTFDFFDDFESGALKDGWTFWNPGSDDKYSLTDRPGWMRIKAVGDSDTFDFVNSAPFIYWTHPAPNTNFVVQAKEDGTGVSTTNRHSLLAYIISLNTGYGNKGYWGAYMSTTSCKFEADGFRGSTANTGSVIHNTRFGKTDSSLYYDWSVDAINWTNAGSYTLPSTPAYWGLGAKSWGGGGGFNADFDYFLVRKYILPEPTCAIGEEELPFKFMSLTYSPAKMNIGDTVFFNATFNNPTTERINVQLAAREADDFNDTTEDFYQEEVLLAPESDSRFPFTWTAVGGPRTVWLSVFGYPLASAKIKVNRDPVIAPVKDQSLWQDRDFLLQVNASDPDGDYLTWSIDDPLFNISAVSNRSAEIVFLPTNDDIGVHRANISVRDNMNRSDAKRINFTVNNVNDPPELAKIPSLSATQYKELRYQAKATDVDVKWGDVLTFTDNTDIFEIDGRTGEFFFTPVEEQIGKHNVKVTVTDTAGASETSAFTITVANVNDPPTLEMLPQQFALQGLLFQLKMVAADPDMKSDATEKLSFSDDCALFNINNGTGLISFTPTNDQLGVWRSNITVTDKGGLSNTTQLTITVMNANDPPALEAIPPQTATEGVPFNYQLSATDPDLKWGLDNLTFSDDTDIFNIDPATGALAFTPAGAQVGIKRVTITVKDEKGATASASFDLTVVHVNHAPTDAVIKYPPDGARLKEGDAMWLEGTAKDTDKGDTLQYSWLDDGEPVGTGRNISVKLASGTHTIKLEVSDGLETVSTEITVQVEKKETVTVSGGGMDWLPLALALAAVVAIVAVVAVLAAKRRKKQQEPEPSGMGRVESVPEGEGIALPAVPPAEAGPKGPGEEGAAGGEEAQKMIDSTLDKLADYQEAHPEEALDVAPVMEKLDIARDMLRSGSNDDALDFAREAKAAVDGMTAPRAPRKVVVKKKQASR